jgi:hypothetical protein
MSEMIERVARVLYERSVASLTWDNIHAASQESWRDLARAALEELRNPTEAMIEASNREWDGRMSHRSAGAWQAMIDAALAEPIGKS